MNRKIISLFTAFIMTFSMLGVSAESSAGGGDSHINIGVVIPAGVSYGEKTTDGITASLIIPELYPIIGGGTMVYAKITTETEIAADRISVVYGSQTVTCDEVIPAGGTKIIPFDITEVSLSDVVKVMLDGTTELLSSHFVFTEKIIFDFDNIVCTQKAVNNTRYEFNISAFVANIGNKSAQDYDITVLLGNNELYFYRFENAEAKGAAHEFDFDLSIAKTDMENDACTVTFKAEKNSSVFSEDYEVKATAELSLESVSAEITSADTESYTYKTNVTVKNAGNKTAENVKISVYNADETEFVDTNALATVDALSITGHTSKTSEITLDLPTASFTENEYPVKIVAEYEDVTCETDYKYTYSTDVVSVLADGKAEITMIAGETASPAYTVQPISAVVTGELAFASENAQTATVDPATGAITAVAEGATRIVVTANETDYYIPLTVTRAYASGELKNIKAFTGTGDDKEYLNLVNMTDMSNGFVYTDKNYRLHINNETSIGLEITAQEGDTFSVFLDGDRGKQLLDSYENISVPLSVNRNKIRIECGPEVYEILVNCMPKLSLTEDTLYAFTDLETSVKLTDYFDDREDDKKIASITVKDDDGTVLGRCEYTDNDWYWYYETEHEAKDIDITITFTDNYGGSVSHSAKLICGKDTENPRWASNTLSALASSTTTATVSWGVATDNDEIAAYEVMYSTNSSFTNAKKKRISAVSGAERKTTLSGLLSSTKYYVKVRAYDRSSNYADSISKNFITNSSSSDSGLGGNVSNGLAGGAVTLPGINTGMATGMFSDLGGYDWASAAINSLASSGVINGVGNGMFAPGANIKRGDFILLLVRGLGLSAYFDSNFDDVGTGAYYYDAVGTAKALGIITGVGNNEFAPENPITRQDMMVMIHRALEVTGKSLLSVNAVTFGDADAISAYAADAVYALAYAGIVQGDNNGNVNPKNYTTRAETAVMLYRILNAVK